MKVTNVNVFPVNGTSKLKANGSVTISDMLDLKFVIVEGPKGPFVSWKGTTSYDKKDGSGKGWDSPIYIKDEALNKEVTTAVMAKYKSVGTGARTTNQSTGRASGGRAAQASYTPAVNDDFMDDSIPF